MMARIFLIFVAFASAQAEDWPQWRGLHRDSVWNETGPLRSFPTDGLKELWRVPVGNGYSSPCVARGRVYVTDSQVTRANALENAHCLDAATGHILWRQGVNQGTTYPVPTPVWKEDHLLLGGLMLKLSDDKPGVSILWSETVRASRIRLSDTSTALIQDGLVFCPTSKGQIRCLDAATGKQLWQAERVTQPKGGASIHLTAAPGIPGVFLCTDEGDLILSQLNASGYKEISRVHLLDSTSDYGAQKMAWAAPACAGRCVFARNDKELVRVSLATAPGDRSAK